MAGTPALRPTAKRFSPFLHQSNHSRLPLSAFCAWLFLSIVAFSHTSPLELLCYYFVRFLIWRLL